MPPHGNLRKPQDDADLVGSQILQVPENKNYPLPGAEHPKALADFSADLFSLDESLRRRRLVAWMGRGMSLQVVERDGGCGAVASHLVVDGVDRDPIEPFEERPAAVETRDVAEDLDEGLLAGVQGVLARQAHLHSESDDPALIGADERVERLDIPRLRTPDEIGDLPGLVDRPCLGRAAGRDRLLSEGTAVGGIHAGRLRQYGL